MALRKLRSRPDEKHGPAPRVITAFISLSARTISSEAKNASHIAWFQQLRFSGRLSVTRATPAPSSLSRTSSGHVFRLIQLSVNASSISQPSRYRCGAPFVGVHFCRRFPVSTSVV